MPYGIDAPYNFLSINTFVLSEFSRDLDWFWEEVKIELDIQKGWRG